jgi:polar amino acid transport system permease protein
MLKGTSIASVIGVTELLHASNNISSHNLLVMETLFAAAIWYMAVVTVAGVGQHYVERAFGGGERNVAAQAAKALRAIPLTRGARV